MGYININQVIANLKHGNHKVAWDMWQVVCAQSTTEQIQEAAARIEAETGVVWS